jgi:hypothetical protein
VSHWCSGYALPNHAHQAGLLDLFDKIDEENGNPPIILLREKDFKPFNAAALAHQRGLQRYNRGNYLSEKKLIKGLTLKFFLSILLLSSWGIFNFNQLETLNNLAASRGYYTITRWNKRK